MTTPAKRKALLASGTLNPRPEAVRSELFNMDFFDPYDFAQVKYEMLRAHSVDEDPVAEVCRQFGLSRESFYQIQQAFQELGFSSFLPRKRGRKGPVKLKGEVLEFALAQKKENPAIDPRRLAALIQERYSIASDDPVQRIYENVRREALENSEPPSQDLERVRRYGVVGLFPGAQEDFPFILYAQSVPRPAWNGTRDFHREKLLKVYEFLTREVMENASGTLRPNGLPDSGSELCRGITVGNVAELCHPERNGDC
jgi:transposase-like protein